MKDETKNSTKGSGWMALGIILFAAIIAMLMYFRN